MGGFPALHVRSPQFQGPMDQFGKMLTLKNLMQRNQMGQMKIESAQQQQQAGIEQRKARAESFMRNKDSEDVLGDSIRDLRGMGHPVEDLIEQKLKLEKASRESNEEDRKQRAEENQFLGGSVAAILQLPPEQRSQGIQMAIQQGVQQGYISPEDAQQYAGLAQASPEELELLLPIIQGSAMGAAKTYSKPLTPQQQAEGLLKSYEVIGKTMRGATNQSTWTELRNFLSAQAEARKIQPQLMDLIPEEYSPEAKKQLASLIDQEKQDLVAIKTMERGKPVTKFVRKEEGAAYPSQPKATVGLQINLPANLPTEGAGETILATLDPSTRALVKGIGTYSLDPARVTSIRGGRREKIIGLTKLVYPEFDMAMYEARRRLNIDFKSGKGAFNIRSLNTAIGHLDSLRKAADGLGNTFSPAWNWIKNYGFSSVGDPRVTKFDAAATAVSGELATLFKGTGGTIPEIEAWRKELESSQSPEQLEAVIDQVVELVASRMEALAGQWESGMGRPKDFRLLNPKSEKILRDFGAESLLELDKIGPRGFTSYESGGTVRMRAPTGQVMEVPQDQVEHYLSKGAVIVQ